jgi:hypothetical protein
MYETTINEMTGVWAKERGDNWITFKMHTEGKKKRIPTTQTTCVGEVTKEGGGPNSTPSHIFLVDTKKNVTNVFLFTCLGILYQHIEIHNLHDELVVELLFETQERDV